ncbi:hypothetical protein [Arthrobacter sp. CJ23]|uniref:hypothetical protein n=1 Tax=Arthrobacter sp. CJ23 TaxID=2972479 RepID=UPI00215D301B|nr:hypothetical protein [Arthrobacter sp. CJ23]UVJ40537.1 hypothetical protein NVV90_05020 [Arthrobacter sp. CJ23]
MELLYVTEFETTCELPEITEDLYQHVLGALEKWLNNGGQGPAVADFAVDGSLEIAAHESWGRRNPDRFLTWEALAAGESRALRLQIVQALETGAEASLVTRCTVSSVPSGVLVRISLAREESSGRLSPLAATSIFQPGLVRILLDDPQIIVRSSGQRLDSRYLQVRTPDDVVVWSEALQDRKRLPIILVHPRSDETWTLAATLARKLIGLARVATVNFRTAQSLRALNPSVAVPFGGALLIWSDCTLKGPAWTQNVIDSRTAPVILQEAMRHLAAVSALVRGSDAGWRKTRAAVDKIASAELEGRLNVARSTGNKADELAALNETIKKLQADVETWRGLTEAEELRANSLEQDAESARRYQEEASYWREQYTSLVADDSIEVTDPWTVIPMLLSGENPSDVFRAIEDASEGHIAFTAAAMSSWRSIDYPDPTDMTDKVVRLARAAQDLYTGTSDGMGHLDKWFKTNFELNVAMKDQTISQGRKLRSFEFEGEVYSQEPHVKVRDGVKPNEVGRIYFDLDKPKQRIVVNHVGLKLYGI